MLRTLTAVVFLLALDPARGAAGEIYDQFPDAIDPAGRYVIYSHGLIVEGDDPRPVSPQFGVYDFPAVVRALAAGSGFHLIAHHRPKNTVPEAYAEMLDGWVRRLLAAKVPPGRITLVGFSRGGQITALASSRLASFEEIAISTGKKHGAFYQPLPEWGRPLRAWIEKTNR